MNPQSVLNTKNDIILKKPLSVGKFTLESLTTGMYSDSLVVFREYIQNSCDSIDLAIRSKLLPCRDESRIEIVLNTNKNEITISDNGIGIQSSKAWNILGDIGKSEKALKEQRGFRGIGRLGGMSYCDKLIFETSFYGEKTKTTIEWNCKDLKEFLKPGEYEELDIIEVMELISSIKTGSCPENDHFFKVTLQGIDNKHPELLDTKRVRDFICQVAPVPFSKQKFHYISEIKKNLKKHGYDIPEYGIYLNDDPNRLTKLYKTRVITSKRKSDGELKTEHSDIVKFEIIKPEKQSGLSFIGWVGRRDTSEETVIIKEKEVSGIRLRKGNIQIGSNEVLKDYYSEPRFNDYFIGEIHILSTDIVPNARRDNFEKVGEYPEILKEINKITTDLSRSIRDASKNKSKNKEFENAKCIIKETLKKKEDGFSSRIEQEVTFEKLDKAKKVFERTFKDVEASSEKIQEAQEGLDKIKNLENEVINKKRRGFITDQLPQSYSKKEKKIIHRVFEIVDCCRMEGLIDQDQTEILKKRIIAEFANKS